MPRLRVLTPDSNDFKRFVESCFGPETYESHDVDTEALLRLEGTERERAETLMIQRLNLSDSRPIEGLGTLRSAQAAPKLKELLPRARGRVLLAISVALWKIEPYRPALAGLINALGDRKDSRTSELAAALLAQLPCEESVDALLEALQDSREMVRYFALESLATLYRIGSRDGLRRGIRSPQLAAREQAIAELRRRLADRGKAYAWEQTSTAAP